MAYSLHVSLGIPVGTFSRSSATQLTILHVPSKQEQRSGQPSVIPVEQIP